MFLPVLVVFVPAWSKKAIGGSKDAKIFEWPEVQMGPRTSDRVIAGKRAAKFIACSVCHERVGSFLPYMSEMGEEELDDFMAEGLPDVLGDVQEVCKMSDLAEIFNRRKMEIKTSLDGTARVVMVEDSKQQLYDESNASDIFDWKAFALQHACIGIFRKDSDVVAKEVKDGFDTMRSKWKENKEEIQKFFQALGVAVGSGCKKASMCKAQLKLTRPEGHDEM